MRGCPRVPWEAEGVFDGISQYKVDKHGKIYEHSVDNVILRDPPLAENPLFAGLNLIPLPGLQRIPQVMYLMSLRRLMHAAWLVVRPLWAQVSSASLPWGGRQGWPASAAAQT